MSVKSVMTALADQVRRLSGRTGKMSAEAMADVLGGVDLGVDASGADAGTGDVVSDKKFVGAAGTVQNGTMPDNGTVTKTLDTSTTSYTIPAGKHSGSGKVSITPQTKTVTPSTSAQTVAPDSGKVLSQVDVDAVASATQATPAITVSPTGLITASATQEEGYVAAGTKSATKQLTTKGATTITPTSSVQTAVAAGTYCTGDVKVGASTGKTVYSGTYTVSSVTGSATINLGVTPSASDTFIAFYGAASSTSFYGYEHSLSELLTAVQIKDSSYMATTAFSSDSPCIRIACGKTSETYAAAKYSGKSVKIDATNGIGADIPVGKFYWFLIKS